MDENWTSSNEDLLNQLYPAHRACRDGDIEKLASLLSTGEVNLYEEDDFYGWTPIHWAAYFGKLQCLTYILEQGGSCDAATERLNQTPSHIAAYGGHCQCLKWLLNCGGTMNRQLACLRRLINASDCMGVKGCDLATSRFSQTCVHLCAFGGHPQCLFWLTQSKCDLNAQDYMGETPIHKAARTGSMECVSLLVSQGANLSLKNYSGNTASQVAMSAGYVDCANYIERAAQLQCQTLGIPATPATNNGNTSVNFGRTSPEGQPSVQNNFISTNTYHSHPHITMNGTSHHPSIQNGLNNNNHDDCDMEMAEESHDSGINQSNCSNGYHGDVQTGDILLNQGVSKNVVPLAGKKRGREDTEEETFKRARQDDYVYEEGNQFAFSQLPFANDYSENMSSMDCNHSNVANENVAPPAFSNNNNNTVCSTEMNHNDSSYAMVPGSTVDDRGHLGEIYQNRQEPFSCTKFREPPVKYSMVNKCKLNGWFVNNGHMMNQLTDHMTDHIGDHVTNPVRSTGHDVPMSESMMEYYSAVTMQQGYDSLMLDSMVQEEHGC